MAAKSPAKPWESNLSAIDSTGSNSVLTPPAPITKHTNNPHINRAGASSTAPPITSAPDPTLNSNTATAPSQPQSAVAQQPLTNSGYGGYGGGMYGNSMYGNSMYGGGGMYGNSMYGGGGMYGNSMYGGAMGMGMNGGMYGPMGPMGPMGFMQMSVNNVGRFSQLLQVASQALHMTFSSLVQFAGNIGMMSKEFGGILSGVYVFRFLKWLYLKIKKFLFWIIGKKASTKEQFEEMFQNAVDATSEQNGKAKSKASSTHYSWLSIGFYCFGILYIIQWIYKSITSELDQQKKLEQQQQPQQPNMMNPMMNPYQQNVGFGQQNPYGGYSGYYGGNMYGAQGPMYGQQAQINNAQTNNANDNKNSDTSNQSGNKSDDKQSESLLAKPKAANISA